jgi:hypothetical protein
MPERRYSDADAAEIFRRATEAQHATPHALPNSAEGLTLSELQAIGREVGIPADLVAGAARSLARNGTPTSRRFLGLPVGVGRTVELDRRLSEAEWEQLVVDLRETFDARGNLRVEGSFRQWTNGNLQALLEPTPGGHRLRLRTIKGNALGYMTLGLGLVGTGVALALAALVGASNAANAFLPLTALGLGAFGVGAIQLPGWARRRREQMEAIAARLAGAATADTEA